MACVSGLTDGVYSYVDCCGITRTGASLGEGVCLDVAYTGSSYGIYIATGVTCTQDCNLGDLSYTFSVTGICNTATGSVIIEPYGGIPPYTIDNTTPGNISAQTSSSGMTFTGLTGGTYVFRLNDSLGNVNNELYINVNVTGCFESSIINASGTTCGLDNGYLEVTATTSGAPYSVVLYKDDASYTSSTSDTLPITFANLPSGIYNAVVVNYGGAIAFTENVVIDTSDGVDFGFWKVNTSTCVIDKGKLSVTGVTGVCPITYLWSNGSTGQTITGLSIGTYSCTVTDALGCSTTKSETIGQASPLGVGLVTATNPTPFMANGSLVYTLTGGTAPFYYSASTSQVGYTLSNTISITGLSSGNYQTKITDANFCSLSLNGLISSNNGFDEVKVVVNNSVCNVNNGSIIVSLRGLVGFYIYTISGQSSHQVTQYTTQNQSHTFSNLASDTYRVTVSGSNSTTSYSETYTLTSTQKFNVTAAVTGATCNQSNGTAIISVSSGFTSPLDYTLSNGNTIIDTSLSAQTYENLSVGSYTMTVTDADGCSVNKSFTISSTGQLTTSILKYDCTGTNNGRANVIIYNGEPPFTYSWSNGSTGSSVNNLGAGDYNVTITDHNGCTTTQYFTIECTGNLVESNYSFVNLCTSQFTTNVGQKRGLSQMVNEGFIDITSGNTNCTFNSADLTCEIIINGTTYTNTFYTATSLNDVIEDILWQTAIETILSGISDIRSYNIDLINNTLTIISDCNGSVDPLSDASFSLGISIGYDVVCEG